MDRYSRNSQFLALSLSCLAGYVDAIGFLKLGGFFVSFMSGNSTQMAVGIVRGTPSALTAISLIGCFVLGVMLGTFAVETVRGSRSRIILSLVGLAICCAGILNLMGQTAFSLCVLTLAMGLENITFSQGKDVLGLTYMTGTLVKLGQRLTYALIGGDRYGWVPYLLLWAGLLAGAALGASLYARLGMNALWFAAIAAFGLACIKQLSQPADI